MTYHRDGSPFILFPGVARIDVLNYGWLSRPVSFATGDGNGWEQFKDLADVVTLAITRGHHECEFCGWDDADYGNGEIWLRLGQQIVRLPRMTWHYIKEHHYALPTSVMTAIREQQYVACSDDDIDVVFSQRDHYTLVPRLRCLAKWKEARYANLMTFQRANGHDWHFSSCYVRDGFYIAESDWIREWIAIQFEADPGNFPDTIDITTVIGPASAIV